MAGRLQIKRGPLAKLPILAEGEMGFTTDEKSLYIGTGSENTKVTAEIDPTKCVTVDTEQTITAAKTFGKDVRVNGNLTADGNITGGKVYGAVWNDYAEWFEKENADEKFEPGDIVSWNKTGVKKSQTFRDSLVVGVVSDTYGHILGGEALVDMETNHERFVPVGLAGRLSVKVLGRVNAGDLIVTGEMPGVGVADNTAPYSAIVGKALESSAEKGAKRIKILIR